MKFFLLATLLFAGTFCSCFAQSTTSESKFNAGLEVALPTGHNATSSYYTGIGGSLKYEYLAGDDFFLSISVGYISFPLTGQFRQEIQQPGASISSRAFIPIKIGGKYYINKRFFWEVQLGNTFLAETNGGQALTFSPGIGYTFDNGLEAGLRYEGWFTNGLVSLYGLRLAYRFKL